MYDLEECSVTTSLSLEEHIRGTQKNIMDFKSKIPKPVVQIPRKKPTEITARYVRKRSKSATDLRLPVEIPPRGPSKQTKELKIPNWDYKSRFHRLNEKHNNLLETYNNLKLKTAGSQKNIMDFKSKIPKPVVQIPRKKPTEITAHYVRKRSKSATDLRLPVGIPPRGPSKQTKELKVPNWDYKSRFHRLNEKHNNLLETYNNLKLKTAGSQ
ncbi:hypothetical protein JTB14_015301 [Gonioctena quinquepunctata]|nr:hypothetical protein JTB14_015301 [Gonioctena quinquepunctata]